MKIGAVALANMLDGYTDQVISLKRSLSSNEDYMFASMATTMVLGFLGNIEDMARRGWITPSVAAELSEDLEEWFSKCLEDWEKEGEEDEEE